MKAGSAFSVSRLVSVFGVVVALACLGTAIFLYLQQVRVEPVLRYKCDLLAFQPVGDDCLEEVTAPVNRKFDAVTSRPAVSGQWLVHPVAKGELVHPSQLTKTPPDRFRFTASGEPLPEGVWGYFMSVPGEVLNIIRPRHLLTLSVADPKQQQMFVVFDKAQVLDKVGNGIFVGLTMDQMAAFERLQNDIRVAAEERKAQGAQGTQAATLSNAQPPEVVWAVTQGANPSLPTLSVFKMELTASALASTSSGGQ
jgi:hypothetical protein